MTIEEIEKEWNSSRSQGPDCSDSEWAQKYADKLIAVAKAAKEDLESGRGSFLNLEKALEDLEKEYGHEKS